MNPIIVISILGGVTLLLLSMGTSLKPIRLIGLGAIKVMIGALFLFFLNAFGGQLGIHVPINVVTSSISGFLGIPGVVGLTIIQTYII
ncbi:pro-sigmaK processing inhibitor BofA family protein [Bacillus spongiae]|uniref:Pro-sigmaK processing inhibitor BofA family protein n=1 Tax=Bacillus spongiae TaxID=2683610 RepID=A0ABU8HKQ3_9BACI